MAEPIDISVRLQEGMPTWPGSAGFRISRTQSTTDGDEANVSKIEMDVHCGTHVEGPLHFIDGGAALDTLPLAFFVGRAHVTHLPNAEAIGPDELSSVPPGVKRLLLRTRNSDAWSQQTAFSRDYVALTAAGAEWIANHGIRLIGVDYLSVQRWGDDPETHRILMRAGVAILEGINLSAVAPGEYHLTCLPLALADAEASPVRAILEALP